MTSPRWARGLLGRLADPKRADDVVGDLEEAHRGRLERHPRPLAWLLTAFEALDMSFALLRNRRSVAQGGPPKAGPDARPGSERPRPRLPFSLLDFKLGFRMLIKYPGLTSVAGLAMAFAIMMGAGAFEFFTDFLYPRIPLDEGERIVEIRNRDLEEGGPGAQVLHDYETWRAEVRTVEKIGAFRTFERNLITERGLSRPLIGAETTADAFQLARVPALLGRGIDEADQRPSAPDVVVISHRVWQVLYGSDPEVVGQIARMGEKQITIVGVMPEGFGWPWAHDLWTPFRLNVLDHERGGGPTVQVVGRLAPDVSLAEANVEIEAIGSRTSADHPETHQFLKPEVARYGRLPLPISSAATMGWYSLNVVYFVLLMLLICGNVALLLFARTAAREGEIVVRSALGASRVRIVTQLMVESLVLGTVSALAGLWAAGVVLRWTMRILERLLGAGLGFWFTDDLSASTIVYALGFAVVASILAGVVPALKVTGKTMHLGLQRAGSGGSGPDAGRLWTVVIVSQIAVTVAVVPFVAEIGLAASYAHTAPLDFPREQYVSAKLRMDRDLDGSYLTVYSDPESRESETRFEAAYTELKRRLTEEPGVSAATAASAFPGESHRTHWYEVDGPTAPPDRYGGFRTRIADVDEDFFDALEIDVVAGRGFTSADMQPDSRSLIVNEDFVQVVLGGRNAIGRRISFFRPSLEPDPADRERDWWEIVGVAEQVEMSRVDYERSHVTGIYMPLGAARPYPLHVAARVGPEAAAFAGRLRELATEVDPALQLHEVITLDESGWHQEIGYTASLWVSMAGGGIALLLAWAGIYSIMSFTVSRRTREIGIRVALGARRRRILGEVFSPALKQIVMGIAGGAVLLSLMGIVLRLTEGFRFEPARFALWLAYLLVMLGVCGIACLVPTRRALGIEPTEALKADG